MIVKLIKRIFTLHRFLKVKYRNRVIVTRCHAFQRRILLNTLIVNLKAMLIYCI